MPATHQRLLGGCLGCLYELGMAKSLSGCANLVPVKVFGHRPEPPAHNHLAFGLVGEVVGDDHVESAKQRAVKNGSVIRRRYDDALRCCLLEEHKERVENPPRFTDVVAGPVCAKSVELIE